MKLKCQNCSHEIRHSDEVCSNCGMEQNVMANTVLAAREKDQTAWNSLYYMTNSEISAIANAMIRDSHAAEDVISETYLKAALSLDQLEKPESFQAWMKKIVHNKAIDYLRKQKRMVEHEESIEKQDGEDIHEIEIEDYNPERLPEVELDRKERKEILDYLLKKLKDEQRIPIVMQYYEGYTYKEIADELGVNISTIKTRIGSGKTILEKEISAMEKRGIPVRGIAPMVFFAALFANGTLEVDAKTADAILRKVTTYMAAKGVINTGVSAVETANTVSKLSAAGGKEVAKAVSTSITKKLGAKIMIGLLAAGVAGTGGYGISKVIKNRNQPVYVNAAGEKAEGDVKDVLLAYQEATKDVETEKNSDGSYKNGFSLIYLDNDDIPELVVGNPKDGEVTLYSYEDGDVNDNIIKTISPVMKYSPKKSKIYNRLIKKDTDDSSEDTQYIEEKNMFVFENQNIHKSTSKRVSHYVYDWNSDLDSSYNEEILSTTFNGEKVSDDEYMDKEVVFMDIENAWPERFVGAYDSLTTAYEKLGQKKRNIEWFQVYRNKLDDLGIDYLGTDNIYSFQFVDIDDNGIPELYVGGYVQPGMILYIDHNEVKEFDVADKGAGFSLPNKTGSFIEWGGRDSCFTFRVCQMKNGTIKELGKLESLYKVSENKNEMVQSGARWNGEKCSTKEGAEKYNSLCKKVGIDDRYVDPYDQNNTYKSGVEYPEYYPSILSALKAIE